MKYSIRYKILFSFSLVIFLGLSLLIIFSNKLINKNNEYMLNKEMIETKKTLDIYLNQYFLINNLEPNKTSFTVESSNISKELSYKLGNSIALYNTDGKIISDINNKYFNLNKDDLSKALTGSIAYSINRIDKNIIVNLSYPVKFKNSVLGIIRYNKDYSKIFNSNERLIFMINMVSLIIFLIILFISNFMLKRIINPITELTKKSIEISQGDLNTNIKITSKDEIGKLAYNFKLMVEKIKEQINIIKKDRDTLKKVEAQRKMFFDNVTHELKTPLTTILGYAQIIQDNGFNDRDFFNKGTSRIISESERLNRMVISLLELSKSSSDDFRYNFKNINITDIIKITCDEMNIKAQKYNINITYSLIEEYLYANGDEDKIKEVLINIIDNSIKYCDVNSSIDISAYNHNSFIVIKIKDKGDGISPENLKNIFDPFYRVSKNKSREKGSSGLGLAISKAIIEKHKGTIEIKSEVGVGTEVIIKLPEIPSNQLKNINPKNGVEQL